MGPCDSFITDIKRYTDFPCGTLKRYEMMLMCLNDYVFNVLGNGNYETRSRRLVSSLGGAG